MSGNDNKNNSLPAGGLLEDSADDSAGATRIFCLHAPIKILSSKSLLGCNIYHNSTVFYLNVDIGPLQSMRSREMGSKFTYAFLNRFLSLDSFVPLNGMQKQFIDRMRTAEGVAFDELLLEAILAVETHRAYKMHDLDTIGFAQLEQAEEGVALVWETTLPKISMRSAEIAVAGVLELLPKMYYRGSDVGTSFKQGLVDLHVSLRRKRLAASTSTLKLAAKKRGIPCSLMGRQHLLLGHGAMQSQLYASMTSTTSSAAQKICADKRQTNRHLRDLRLPVAKQIKVGSIDEAVAASIKLGFPVVIKPLKGSRGRGVSVGVGDAQQVAEAFSLAHKSGNDVLVEVFVPGIDHRLLVVGNRFVAALKRRPPMITGDGTRSIKELIETLNDDPYRDGFRRYQIELDAELEKFVGAAGYALDSVLANGRTLVLRGTANISTGGVPVDITDRVHPDNILIAERAAKGLGLDVAGIDFMTTDITRSHREVGGAIIEMNTRPGLCIHTWPEEGQPRNVAAAVLNLSFPPGAQTRLPIAAIAGDKSTGAVARWLDSILRKSGRSVALALSAESFVNGSSAGLSDKQQQHAPLALLRDPDIDTVVNTVSLRKAARQGLQLEYCKVCVIMNRMISGDGAAFNLGIDVMRRATSDCFVVDAGNVVAQDRLGELDDKRLILVSDRHNDPSLLKHQQAGGDSVTLLWHQDGHRIALMSGTKELATFAPGVEVARTGKAKLRRLRSGKMFAIAAAYAMGVSADAMSDFVDSLPAVE